MERMRHVLAMLACGGVLGVAIAAEAAAPDGMLQWHPLPDLPETIGVAGPIVGVSNDALIVAGGANFPAAAGEDRWAVPKVWHSDAWVLVKEGNGYRWLSGFALDRPVAYAACATTHRGIVCIGGSDQSRARADCFLLRWSPPPSRSRSKHPALPQPCAHGSAAVIGEIVYVAGGQSGMDLETAMTNFWRLDMANPIAWERLPGWCGPSPRVQSHRRPAQRIR